MKRVGLFVIGAGALIGAGCGNLSCFRSHSDSPCLQACVDGSCSPCVPGRTMQPVQSPKAEEPQEMTPEKETPPPKQLQEANEYSPEAEFDAPLPPPVKRVNYDVNADVESRFLEQRLIYHPPARKPILAPINNALSND
ncbi:hypothetical protein KOR42_11060 [Thalassoglobus neptunius]|uniref:Uncharacterized protein n=1 Tax=Thalassoglobus neptunius TaxID=1938619 RepID=A0A5C5X4D4_9PLAN|nr:hypothetical protein [Thalassoglobus neptunius]TWT57740.1 hypothetical protein KOR42_11060 [Thalassoglobus neptunius]